MLLIERDWLSSNQVMFFDEQAGEQEATLLDSGYGTHAQFTLQLVEHALSARGLQIKALRTLINTHLHSDHCGGNALIAEKSGCRVLVPAAEFNTVRDWDEDALTFRATSQHCERFSADAAVGDGDELLLGGLQWRAHAAPGHDPHSLILFCEEHRLLISADALWENGFGIIFPELSGESGFPEQQSVLDLIESLDAELVIPGHGQAFGQVPAAIARARARLAALRDDPQRNARNALKALIKFLMLEMQTVSVDLLLQRVAQARILHNAAQLLQMSLEQAILWTLDALEKSGQIRRDGDRLSNDEPQAVS